MALKIERIYTKPADTDGYRILVDVCGHGNFKGKAALSGLKPLHQPKSCVSGSAMIQKNTLSLKPVISLNWTPILTATSFWN